MGNRPQGLIRKIEEEEEAGNLKLKHLSHPMKKNQ
jgi:hypothetical protein